MASDRTQRNLRRVAQLIGKADALLITAGAGMGVDSGLPDFRGREGFWRAYPALGELGISFEEMAQPSWFFDDPTLAWGFYGHRQRQYRDAVPQQGFRILLEWGRSKSAGFFVATSNVDGHFDAAGFGADRVLELHGNIHTYQCTRPCTATLWSGAALAPDIEPGTLRARGDLPRCPQCGALARPNVLMFGDATWVSNRTNAQRARYLHWLTSVRGRRLVVLELGAGKTIPTVRRIGEDLAERGLATLVRVNPEASDADEPAIPIRLGALEALRGIDAALREASGGTFRATDASAETTQQQSAPIAERLPRPVSPRPLEIVDLPEDCSPPGNRGSANAHEPDDLPDTAPTTARIRLHVKALTQVDMNRGLIGLADTGTLRFEDESECMRAYIDAQTAWVPMPVVNGLSAPGFTMTARVFRTPEYDAGGTPGIAIVFVQTPDEEAVMTLGLARRESDAPFLWQFLYDTSKTKLPPLDFPRVPWVARRSDIDPAQHAQVMPYLAEFERTLALAWLRLAAFIDATKPKRDGPP